MLIPNLGSNVIFIRHGPTGSMSQGSLPTTGTIMTKITPAFNTTKWTISSNSTYGTFTGTFELTDPPQKRTVPFSGVLRQSTGWPDDVIGDGHFLLPPLTGAPSTEKTSGEVLLTR
jgi:hypothetical protein